MSKGQMKLYTSTGTIKTIEKCNKYNVGLLMVATWRNPDKWPFFAIDNGCYSAYSRKEEWNASTFLNLLHKCKSEKKKPDFIVIPDMVADTSSLEFSMKWLPVLETMYSEFPRYLAVQDGMTPYSILNKMDVDKINGIFIGGTMEWKLEHIKEWVNFAHEQGLNCHVGRIGPIQRMLICEIAGADSIDSTTWVQVRGGVDKYIGGYKTQTKLEVGE